MQSDQINVHEVNQATWLYPDRCMAKWMGWLLSDHSAFLEDAASANNTQEFLPQMSPAAIESQLEYSWEHSHAVSIQLTTLVNDEPLPSIEGVVVGYGGGQINLMLKNSEMSTLNTEDMRNVQPMPDTKWWDEAANETPAETSITITQPSREAREYDWDELVSDASRQFPEPIPGTPFADLSRLPMHDYMCIDCKSLFASVESIRRAEYPLAAKNAVLSRADSAGGLILAASPLCKANYHVKLGTRYFEIKPI